jgi:hypothetical protein
MQTIHLHLMPKVKIATLYHHSDKAVATILELYLLNALDMLHI